MLIVRKHPFNGKINSRHIEVTVEQLLRWENGELIQKAMPNLTSDEREFIMTGLLPQDFEDMRHGA